MNLLRISCAIACATPGGGPLGLVALDPNNHVSGAEPLVGTRKQQCDAATLMAVFSPQTQEANAGAASAKVDECTRIQRSVAWALRAHPGTPYSKEGRNE